MRGGVDVLAMTAAALAAAMAAVYVRVMHAQDDQPLIWVLLVLVAGALAAAYGSVLGVPHRQLALVAGGTVLVLLGVLAILTIGVPILVSGVLSLVAGSRRVATSGAAGRR